MVRDKKQKSKQGKHKLCSPMGRLPNLKAQRPEENNQRKKKLYIWVSLIFLKYIGNNLNFEIYNLLHSLVFGLFRTNIMN